MKLADRVALAALLLWCLLWMMLSGCEAMPEPMAHGPAAVWLDYADGATPAPTGSMYTGLVPPAADCDGACRGRLQDGLRARFGDLAIDFVESEPAGPHLTVVLSSGGDAWTTDSNPRRGGISQFTCQPIAGATSFVFLVGNVDDDTLAIMVAHELGHDLGLEHTMDDGSTATLMAPDATIRGQSFGNAQVVDDVCGRTVQDEPKMLEQALGYRTVTQ
jgi:hypothetical protein